MKLIKIVHSDKIKRAWIEPLTAIFSISHDFKKFAVSGKGWREMGSATIVFKIKQPMKRSSLSFWQFVIGVLFIAAGTNHFIMPKPYLEMMPAYLPAHVALVEISGIAEILGGLGVLIPSTRRLAAWGLILLLLAVFPANLNAALHGWPDHAISRWILWARLPFQIVFIWWVYRVNLAARISASNE